MIALPRPAKSVSDVMLLCASGLRRSDDLRKRVQESLPSAEDGTRQFETAVAALRADTVSSSDGVGSVSRDEMCDLYERRLVGAAGTPGRAIYNYLMSLPRRGLCPLCMQRCASTLDHYLPKSRYSALALTPTNLIPACIQCNFVKASSYPRRAAEQTFNPYLHTIPRGRWLAAKLLRPISVEYFVACPAQWPVPLASLIVSHFDSFRLAKLYETHAGRELVEMRGCIEMVFSRSGASAVADWLREQATSIGATNENSWRAVLYSALATDSWFCSAGFDEISR